MFNRELWVGSKKKRERVGGGGGGGGGQKFPKLCLQPLLQKSLTTKQTKRGISNQLNEEAIRQEKLREITKCLL